MTRRIRNNSRINRKSYPRRPKRKTRKNQNRKITKKRNSYRTRKYKYRKLHSGGSGRRSMRGSCCAAPSLSPRRPTRSPPRRVASPRAASPRAASPRAASPRAASPRRLAPPPAVASPRRMASPQRLALTQQMTSTTEPEPEQAALPTPRTKSRQMRAERERLQRQAAERAADLADRKKHPDAYAQKGALVALPVLRSHDAGHVREGYATRFTDLQKSVGSAAAKKAVGERAEALPVRAGQLDTIDQVMRMPLGESGIHELPNEALSNIARMVRQSSLPSAKVVAAAKTQRKK
jgi:hypothetical protein